MVLLSKAVEVVLSNLFPSSPRDLVKQSPFPSFFVRISMLLIVIPWKCIWKWCRQICEDRVQSLQSCLVFEWQSFAVTMLELGHTQLAIVIL